MDMCLGGCEKANEQLGLNKPCCVSCHGEWDDGYNEPIEIQVDGGYYLVCCAKAIEWRDRNEPHPFAGEGRR